MNTNIDRYIALIICPDRRGLIHQITGCILKHHLNIIGNEEFVDLNHNTFFMRTSFEGSMNIDDLKRSLHVTLPDALVCDIRKVKPKRLVVMASREVHCLGDLLVRQSLGELKAEILAVISQHEDCRKLVERFNVPFHHIPVQPGTSDRKEHEERVLRVISTLSPEYIVLARYMRIFSPEFVSHFPEKIINIHHSFLPAFIGKDPYQQAYQRGVKIIGATSHFVIAGLDQGPIIAQDIIRVNHTYSAEAMAHEGREVEKNVLAKGVKLVLEDRVLVSGNKTVVFTLG